MKIRVTHPNVPPFTRQTVLGYYEANILDRFDTTFMDHPDYWLSNLIRKVFPFLRPELKRRFSGEIPIKKIKNFPWREIMRTGSSKYLNTLITDFIWEWAELGFDHWAAKNLTKELDAVHCYEHAGLETLKRAKELGIFTVYEQPSQHHAYFTVIANDQIRKYPELSGLGQQLLVDDKAKRRNKRRDEELRLADLIICNSTFTRGTLIEQGISESKIEVIPYGFPVPAEIFPERNWSKLIFLNAGTQNLRKALHLLYKAWRTSNFNEKEAELWLIGKMNLPESTRNGLPGKVIIQNSIPHQDLMKVYLDAHIFVLPTLADGFGMVLTEAMSRGLIVITTENSGGPDIITHGVDGLIIPAGDENAIKQALIWCSENKAKLPEMSRKAWEKSKTWQWSDYRRKVADRVSVRVDSHRLI